MFDIMIAYSKGGIVLETINRAVQPATLPVQPEQSPKQTRTGSNKTLKKIYKYRYYYLMLSPVIIMLIIFSYIPMLGIRFAFCEYTPFTPFPKFVGLKNFYDLFHSMFFLVAFRNTLFLSLTNLILGTVISVIFALLMNELVHKTYKSITQTILYMPHFISWVVTASIFYIIFSPQSGFVNQLIIMCGGKPVYFLANEGWWTPIYIFMCRWKDTGWGTVIYLAALSGINPDLYEASSMDGAGRWRQTWHVTLPGITNTILIVFILNLSKVMNLFESAFVMQNASVSDVSEVIQTYVYKVGLQRHDFGYSTAVGLFNSLIGMALVIMSNQINKKFKGEGII